MYTTAMENEWIEANENKHRKKKNNKKKMKQRKMWQKAIT